MDILVAVDGSDRYSEQVVEFVAPWLRKSGGQAQLLTVLDVSEIYATTGEIGSAVISPLGTDTGVPLRLHESLPRIVEDRTQAIARVEDEVRTRLSALARRHFAGIRHEINLISDEDTVRAITTQAQILGVDAISIGRKGRGSRAGAYLGRIADGVLLDAPVPVIAV